MQSSYISCIKIDGKPILPPMLTPELRKQCEEYRQKAINVELDIQRRKIFHDLIKDFDDNPNIPPPLPPPLPPPSATLENQLTFDGNKLANIISDVELVSITNSPTEPNTASTPRPKLIRSNSYTLEGPSPILLAHLEKEAQKSSAHNDSFESISINLSPVTIVDTETPDLIETDVTIDQLTITTPITAPHCNLDPFDSELEPELVRLLSKLPENCAKNIMEIISTQKQNQKVVIEKIKENRPLNVSISSNQSIFYSLDSSKGSLVNQANLDKREWAASKIGAYVRGYLTRRLIKTEKVQVLIDTIKDVLLCAIQLHTAEVIDEADVELHRRLIQQVSAACSAFHDIFFTLSTKEKLAIIALDRQRREEKARRPSIRILPPGSGRNKYMKNLKSVF